MRTFPLVAAILVGFPVAARAELPPCVAHLEHAPTGGVLDVHQNDINNNCLRELQTASVVAELASKIRESDSKRDSSHTVSAAPTAAYPGTLTGPGYGAPFLPQMPSAPPLPATQTVQTSAPALPRIVMIASDGSHYVATLRLPDGTTIDAVSGTTLSDGLTVAVVTAKTVFIRRGKNLVQIGDDDGTAFPSPTSPVGSSGASPATYPIASRTMP